MVLSYLHSRNKGSSSSQDIYSIIDKLYYPLSSTSHRLSFLHTIPLSLLPSLAPPPPSSQPTITLTSSYLLNTSCSGTFTSSTTLSFVVAWTGNSCLDVLSHIPPFLFQFIGCLDVLGFLPVQFDYFAPILNVRV